MVLAVVVIVVRGTWLNPAVGPVDWWEVWGADLALASYLYSELSKSVLGRLM